MADATDTVPGPGGPTPAGDAAAAARGDVNARSFFRDADGHLWRDLKPGELATALKQEGGQLWVDVDSTQRCQHALLEKVFGFHPLSIEDTLSPNGRVKIEEFPNYLFVTLRAVSFCETTDDPYDLDTANLYLFVGSNFLVTAHSEKAPPVEAVMSIVERNPDILERGVGRISHMVMDNAIDEYFPILDQVDGFVDTLEERVFAQFDQSAMQDIFQVKRLVLSLRRYLAPQREVFNALANRPTKFLDASVQVYFRDVYDHVLRINDSLDTYRELLSSTMDSYLTQVSNRLGHITKGLSVVATISIPFVVISGMYGMNFQDIPLSHHPHGFWIMLVLQVAIGVGLVALLKWKELL
jgi:magnesium transporter